MFCTQCGKPLDGMGHCSSKCPRPAGTQALVLPKPTTVRRLTGAGTEFTVYLILVALIPILSALTFLADVAVTIPLLLMLLMRDTHGGRFSLAKRFGRMRVVKAESGLKIDTRDALKRNSYYLIMVGITALPILPLDLLSSGLFNAAVLLDVLLIVYRKDGRRVGDLLAGTQVVHVTEVAA